MPGSFAAHAMRYCLNPTCKEPQNLDSAECCQACGSSLRLQHRYCAIALIGQGGFGRTFLAIDGGGVGSGEWGVGAAGGAGEQEDHPLGSQTLERK